MATATEPVNRDNDPKTEETGGLRAVARQPILDLQGRVHAFKLLLRGPSQPGGEGKRASEDLLETAAHFRLAMPSELKKLTGKLTALVSCPAEALNEQLAQTLPATLTVLEIAGTQEPSPELIEICGNLKALGFRFALADSAGHPPAEPLLKLADYIEVDFSRTRPEERAELLRALPARPIPMLATGVETRADYVQARDQGFTLFAGYYFWQPEVKKNRRPPANQLLRIEIMQALQQHPLDLRKVSQLVKRDGPMTYQLLRLANSPLWALRQAVESIEGALLAVGDDAFRRIATLAIAREFNGDQPAELLGMAMIRGRFCEAAGRHLGLDPFAQYLLGLLSLLPAMQGQPMKEAVQVLPLSAEIREALVGTRNRERALLGWLECYERGDWPGCDAAAETDDLNQAELVKTYIEAIAWTEAALYSVG
jgi:EAL and modified HD-GYP domain-containing signal transduction protein